MFEKGQLIYSGHTGNRLYKVIGYNAGGGIILLPMDVEDKRQNYIVFGVTCWLYAKKGECEK
jgi:hypothetical protein